MESTLQILQTIGICVSAIALVVIAFFIFLFWSSFVPPPYPEDEENEPFIPFIDAEELEQDQSYRKRKRRPPKR